MPKPLFTPRDSTDAVPRGFRWAAAAAAIKKPGRLDVAFAEAAEGTTAAAVFTKNLVVAAPVTAGRIHMKKTGGRMRAVIVNAGNANCATGNDGFERCKKVCYAVADEFGIEPREVFPSSTGVIGVQLPEQKIIDVLPRLRASLSAGAEALQQFAEAILTTDTRRKIACVQFRCAGETATMVGVAKGAGMIHPNMATMLGYIFTDAGLSARDLQKSLNAAVGPTFNAISVDGDTSTNDTVLLLASGAAGGVKGSGDLKNFNAALGEVCGALAHMIVADGEGVQHVVRVRIEKARSEAEAHQVGNVIATSPLVKTAFAGADPNWGRILAAIGRAGVALDPARVDVYIGEQRVCRRGMAAGFDEGKAHATMSQPEYEIRVVLNRGRARVTVLTCDLSDQYVHINADYRS